MAAQEGSILPLEMLMKVFSYLDMQELDTIVAPVCRLWRDTSRLPVVRRRLTLNRKIDRSAAHEMLRRCPQLTELTIDGCDDNDDLLRIAAEHNLKLRVLDVRGPVSDIGLEAVAQCDQLRTLTLYNTRDVTDGGVAHLARLRLLEELELRTENQVTPAGWSRLFSMCEWPHLRRLSLWMHHGYRDVSQLQLERLPTLRSLELWGPVSDMHLMAVSQLSQLRTLLLREAHDVTDDGVVRLARLSNLDKLELCHLYNVTAAGLRRLFSMCEWRNLRELCLVLHDKVEVPQVHFDRLPTSLRSINLWGEVSDVDLEAVAQCDQLQTLSLRHAFSSVVTDDGVMHFAQLSHLVKLELHCPKVTAAGWRRLFSMCEWPHLRELCLELTIADREVPQVHFDRLPSLRSLELWGPVSDIDLMEVSQCHQLRTLTLFNTREVTDDGVGELAQLRHLEILTCVTLNSVTPAGWRRLFSMCEWPHLRGLHLTLLGEVGKGDRDSLRRQAELLCPDVTIS